LLLALRRLRRDWRDRDDLPAQLLPAVAGGLIAITVGDLFVQYPKLEIRFWLFTVLMSMLSTSVAQRAGAPAAVTHAADADDAGAPRVPSLPGQAT